jgi:glycosyltransferase involved in cell wall biosynthesis
VAKKGLITMIPPLVSFITWNRLGLTARNLKALLATTDEFELHLVDNNSQDGTWEYLQDLKDSRIKSRTRFEANRGPVYAGNYNLAKRAKDQYFITVDSDVNIHTPDWISRFLEAFRQFPEVGLLGAVSREYYDRYRQPLIEKEKNGTGYLQLHRGFVEGCCQCLRPELLDQIGYWSEECCLGDAEICFRICNYTPFKAGFFPAVEIDQVQSISCDECGAKGYCLLKDKPRNCFDLRNEKYRNPQFKALHGWKYRKYVEELAAGKRSAYCGSVHDGRSMEQSCYNRHLAEENFRYYIENAN